ncbi:MAG: diaminopimelate decarboxylase [Halodesulfurarchaeum sp.]
MTGAAVRRLEDWSADQLTTIAREVETPAYVLDLDRVRENLDRLQAAFPAAGIHYAVKANAGRTLLETLASTAIGAEAASAGEVRRAFEAGFAPASIMYTPVNPPGRDLDAVLSAAGDAITITVGSMDTIDRLGDRGFAGPVAIRVHPETGAGHSESVATGADAKFGIAIDRITAAVEAATELGMTVDGLHAHTGSGLLTEDIPAHRQVVEALASVAQDLPVDLSFVDVGGGFGVPYREDEAALNLGRIAASTREALAGLDVSLRIEPGRYLVADAGVLLTTVNTTKPTVDGVLAGVDAGMSDLLRPALYGSSHPIRNLDAGQGREVTTVSVVGPICESTDVLAENRGLPRPRRGDLLAIGMTGAYGIEMANQYNSRPRPPVVAIEDGEFRQARRRETIDDVIAAEVRR